LRRLDSCEAIKTEVNNNNDSGDNTRKMNISELLSLKTLLPPILPEEGSEFDLTVSYAVSPDNFVIVAESVGGVDPCPSSLSSLRLSMSKYYEGDEGGASAVQLDIRADRFAAAKLDNGDWHRVEVLQVIDQPGSSLCVVRYVDQGSQAMLDTNMLRSLAVQFRNIPCQAVTAALAGVRSLTGWSPEDNYWFNSRVTGRTLRGKVRTRDHSKVVIELMDSSQKIHEQLIREGRGQEQEEKKI